MHVLCVVAPLVVLLAACETASQPGSVEDTAGCYSYDRNGDRVTAQFDVRDRTVEGTLAYDFAEKDDNIGTFTGMLHGDTLLGVYTFQSEGQASKREVAFLRQGETLREGYGNSEVVGEVQRFVSPSGLVFGQGIVLARVPCED